MKRIDIEYGGRHFSVGNRDVDDILIEIADGVRDGPRWLRVNDGEGLPHEALLLLAPGIPVAVIPVAPDDSV